MHETIRRGIADGREGRVTELDELEEISASDPRKRLSWRAGTRCCQAFGFRGGRAYTLYLRAATREKCNLARRERPRVPADFI
jgi:hypothetical protein